jgi:predicted nucleotidyltransferase
MPERNPMVDVKKTLIRIIHSHLPKCSIMLFGSRARNSHTDGADYDIAIDAGHTISLKTMNSITSDIEESNIHVQVDVIDIHAISQTFFESIQKDLITWTNE